MRCCQVIETLQSTPPPGIVPGHRQTVPDAAAGLARHPARIGEVLTLRRRDVDIPLQSCPSASPERSSATKQRPSSDRIIRSLRKGCACAPVQDPSLDALLFCNRGTPLTTNNIRRPRVINNMADASGSANHRYLNPRRGPRPENEAACPRVVA